MRVVKSIIVDDELNGRENLRSILQQYCPEVQIVAEAGSAMEAIDEIRLHKPNLVFLDIEMPGGNGFDVLHFFSKPEFKVIFVTAYDHYAIDAIRFSALDYILKPIDVIALRAAIERFIDSEIKPDRRVENFIQNNALEEAQRKLALSFSDKIEFIAVNEIIYCRGEGGYTTFVLSNGKEWVASKPLMEYQTLLANSGFIRTHKTYLVNVHHVNTFVKTDGGFVEMSNKHQIPVSRRRKEQIIAQLKQLA